MTLVKRVAKNKGFWLGASTLLFCYLCASIESWMGAVNEPIRAYRPNALMLSLEAILFGGVILVFPFCACLPNALKSKYAYGTEGSISLYMCHTFIMGGMTVTIPFILHTLLWNTVALPVNPAQYESHRMAFYGLLNILYDKCYGLPIYIIFAGGMFLCGGTYALMHLAASTWISDDIAAFAIPSVFYFAWLKTVTSFTSINLPSPVDLFDEGLTIYNACALVIIYLHIIVLCIKVYKKGVEKGGAELA